LIRRFPNGATQCYEVTLFLFTGKLTQGTETSKYLEEEKTIVIPSVAASEMGIAQNLKVPAFKWL
jgi:hypothetical protein